MISLVIGEQKFKALGIPIEPYFSKREGEIQIAIGDDCLPVVEAFQGLKSIGLLEETQTPNAVWTNRATCYIRCMEHDPHLGLYILVLCAITEPSRLSTELVAWPTI